VIDLQADPVSTWILARLYDEDAGVTSRQLVKQLCQKSFQAMTSDDDYRRAMITLGNQGYITNVDSNTHMITETGMIGLRRQVVYPIDKFIENGGNMPTSIRSKFYERVHHLQINKGHTTAAVVKWCIENTPEVLEFIKAIKGA
jgi:hypothetical protein